MTDQDQRQTTEIAIIKQEQKTMSQKIDDLSVLVKDSFKELKSDLKKDYVSKDSFMPVRLIAYGLAGYILISVLTTLANSVLIK